jgi:hypothetical protein
VVDVVKRFHLFGLRGEMGLFGKSVHGIPGWVPVGMAARLQGSRASEGDRAAGRAKWLCEKGMGDEMLESPAIGEQAVYGIILRGLADVYFRAALA